VAHRGAGTPRSAKLRDNGTPIELTLREQRSRGPSGPAP
jgi:hypothetical protein